MPIAWQRMKTLYDKAPGEDVWRAKVPGGWIVKHVELPAPSAPKGFGAEIAMVFVPDPKHEWTE